MCGVVQNTWQEVTGGQTHCITLGFIICTLHHIYHDGMCGKCSIHDRHTDISRKFMLWAPEDKRTLERDIYRWEDNIKVNPGQLGWKVWTGFILFTTGFGSQLLC